MVVLKTFFVPYENLSRLKKIHIGSGLDWEQRIKGDSYSIQQDCKRSWKKIKLLLEKKLLEQKNLKSIFFNQNLVRYFNHKKVQCVGGNFEYI